MIDSNKIFKGGVSQNFGEVLMIICIRIQRICMDCVCVCVSMIGYDLEMVERVVPSFYTCEVVC